MLRWQQSSQTSAELLIEDYPSENLMRRLAKQARVCYDERPENVLEDVQVVALLLRRGDHVTASGSAARRLGAAAARVHAKRRVERDEHVAPEARKPQVAQKDAHGVA